MQHAPEGDSAGQDPAVVRFEANQYLPALIEVHQVSPLPPCAPELGPSSLVTALARR